MSVPDQFEDADEHEVDEDAFLLLMRERLGFQQQQVSKQISSGTQLHQDAVADEQIDHVDYIEEENDDEDDEDDEFYMMDDDFLLNGALPNSGALSSSSHSGHNYSSTATSSKRMNLSHAAQNSVSAMEKIEVTKRSNHQGKDERATTEQCLDPRTRLILFRFLSSGFLEAIDGCLSTGKEANVYYAKRGNSTTFSSNVTIPDNVTEFAIKIYKTSILVFKDRDKYVTGEHRWRRGYCKSNPRKMVKVWAEKELRNYRRLYTAGIPCPAPIYLKSHVLLMEFLGTNQWPAPRLKDATLSSSKLAQAHIETMLIMRHMYQRCKLVHGDLSEYNLLWHKGKVYVIDVSQSVETSHPMALELLRIDCANVNDYFAKMSGGGGTTSSHQPQQQQVLPVLTTRQLFEFVTTPLSNTTSATSNTKSNITATTPEQQKEELELEMAFLHQLFQQVEEEQTRLARVSEQDRREHVHKEQVEEAVFMSQYLPRSLKQVGEYEMARMEEGLVEESYAKAVTALTSKAAQGTAAVALPNKRQANGVVKIKAPLQQQEQQDSAATTLDLQEATRVNPTSIGKVSSHLSFDNDRGSKVAEPKEDETPEGKPEDDSSSSDEIGDSESDEEEDDDDSNIGDDQLPFVKVARTPDQVLAEKEAIRAMRRANKKLVKDERTQKRVNKIKKKDKKKAIKKTKSGNRKNK